MELDILLDSTINGGGCMLASMAAFIGWAGTSSGRKMVISLKLIGILIDIIYILSYLDWSTFEMKFKDIDDETSFIIYSVCFISVDRIGAIIMLLIYGMKPTKQYQYYANEMNIKNHSMSYQGIITLYYGAAFSYIDFCGQIHKSYSHVEHQNNPKDVQIAVEIQMSTNPAPQPNVVVLPAGWRVAYTNGGKMYYVNDMTKTTQWEYPSNTQQTTDELEKQTQTYSKPPMYKSWGFATWYFVTNVYYTVIVGLVVIYSVSDPLSFSRLQATLLALTLQFQVVAIHQHWINFSTGVDKLCCCESCKTDVKNDKLGGCTCAVQCTLLLYLFFMEAGLLWFWMSSMLGYEA